MLRRRNESNLQNNAAIAPNVPAPRPLTNFDLVDIVLISFANGRLSAFNRQSGRLVWSIQLEPDIEGASEAQLLKKGGFVAEPKARGRVFRFSPKTGFQPLALNLQELVQTAPFGVHNGVVYTGSCDSHLLAIDLLTGKVVHTYGGGMPNKQTVDPKKTVLMGRSEYNLDIYASDAHKPFNSRIRVRQWTPNTRDDDLGVQLQAIVTQNTGLGEPPFFDNQLSVKMLSNNTLIAVNHIGEPVWAAKTEALMTGVFDVLRARIGGSLAVIPAASTKFMDTGDLYVQKDAGVNTPVLVSGEWYHALTSQGQVAPFCVGGDSLNGVHPYWCQSAPLRENLPSIGSPDYPLLDPPVEVTAKGYNKWMILITLVLVLGASIAAYLLGMFSTPKPKRKRGARGKRRRDKEFPFELSEEVLGYGSHGTTVLKGTFMGREVAIKRMLVDFQTLASQEVHVLRESDDHPNVVRYYLQHQNKQFLYIVLELCPGTLEDVLRHKLDVEFEPVNALKQVCFGLAHLHGLNVVHRDIKPQNILVSVKKDVKFLISDFGLCKKLENSTNEFTRVTSTNAAGTQGWTAPEILDGTKKLTKAVDIFSLGLLFYYTLSDTNHPFGETHMQQANIQARSPPNLAGLSCEASNLIKWMLEPNPQARPKIHEVLAHPFFWTARQKLDFLNTASDKLEHLTKLESPVIAELESHSFEVLQNDWYAKFPESYIENLGKYRRYHQDRIVDLLRALRNKFNHYNDFTDDLKALIPKDPEGYLSFYSVRFPKLFMVTYEVFTKNKETIDADHP